MEHISFTFNKGNIKTMSNYKYTDEIVARMRAVVGNEVTAEAIDALHQELGFPKRSISAKLRSMNFVVPTKVEAPVFSAEETKSLTDFLVSNSGQFTAEEVSTRFAGGKFSKRQIMGKVLSLELNTHVKKAEKKDKPKTYTANEENLIVKLVGEGKYLEEIADALGKNVNSVRGKLLSMELKAPQKNKKAPVEGGSYPDLAKVAPTKTVEELVAHYPGKTARGIKTALSRRGIAAKDYEPNKKAS
jgi:hypothetical protein